METSQRPGLSRRGFLRGVGATWVALSLGRLGPSRARARAARPPTPRPYRGWPDVYRHRWRWDRIAKSTHFVNCWYQRGCAWNVYVKDGVVFREEQVGLYPQTRPDVPDFNPRGCQKGACYSARMVDAGRLRYPLKRLGARGAGRWKRISWDEALREIADRMLDVLQESGPGAIVWDFGTGATNGCLGLGLYRTGLLLDTPILDMNAEIGDHHPGALATCGKISFASSGDDWFHADLILIWGGNPLYTQIPNAHFLTEARYRGAKIVTIAPDFSPSAVHADLWIPVAVGSDAALGLALASVIVEEGLHDEAFVAEQTDLALLVRTDTRRFLRASDLERDGDGDRFYVFDRASGRVRHAPRRSLRLGSIRPALEGRYRIPTRSGEIEVVPAFSLLRERLRQYAPERSVEVTGVPPRLVRELAREIARARAATFMTQSNFSKYYHGLEMERAQILVLALCGQIGRKGAGITGFPFLTVAGTDALNVARGGLPPKLALLRVAAGALPKLVRAKLEGLTDEMFLYQASREEYRHGGFLPSTLFFYQHGGLKKIAGQSRRWDPHLKRSLDDHLEEALAKGWQITSTAPPRILIEAGGNLLRRIRGYDRLERHLLPKLDLLVTIDWRMSNTALHSDIVLPAAGWYEKDDITWATPIAPFAHVTTRAVEPLAEAKSDWEFHCLLLKTLERRARERGIRSFRDRRGKPRPLDGLYHEFTFGGRFTEKNPEEFLDTLLQIATNLGGMRWKELKERGFARYTGLGMSLPNIGNATDIRPGETITANTWHTEKKLPWPTLTRRIQFYIDHELYLELGEELPVHKDPPPVGGNYPLMMTGGHTRWSIHASWRDEVELLRLQRGGPVVLVSERDARRRGLSDGAAARLRNDFGACRVRVKVSPAIRPGQVVVYHAWEPYQFPDGRSHQTLTPSPLNPIQLAGGYFHLQPMMITGEPGMHDRATRVELEPLEAERRAQLEGPGRAEA